jgi:hypothetical protein
MRRGLVHSLAVLCSVAACDTRSGPLPAEITSVTWTDSILLAIPESLALAAPGGLLVLPDRGFVVSDAGSARLLVFAANGQLTRAIGKRGRGPAEMLVPASLELLGPDTVAVVDNPTGRLVMFRLSDGAALQSPRLPGPTTDIRRSPDGLWLAGVSLETGSTHARWNATTTAVERGGSIPTVFTEFPRIARNLALPVLAARGDTVWVGLFGENGVRRYIGTTSKPDQTLEFPRLRRRGVPLNDRAWLQSEMSYEDELGAVSVMRALGLLTDGRVAVVHLDVTVQDDVATSVGFLSVHDPATGATCVDLALPPLPDSFTIVHFAEDALHALVWREDEEGERQFWMYRYEIERC